MKILTVALGLETGVIDRNSRILDTGRMRVGGWPIQNYDYYRHPNPGLIDLKYLFVHSSNIASAKIAMDIKAETYHRMLKTLGMGQRTGIDIPGESSGLFRGDPNWDISTHASLGYGYGLGATPIQMAAAVGSIANQGQWVQPHVIKQTGKPLAKRQVLSPKTCKVLTDILVESIQQSPRNPANVPGLDVAGKTGTSKKPKADGPGYSKDLYTSFAGYFPAQNPEVLVMVVVDSPKIPQAWGSTVAAPIFREIAEETIHYLGIPTQSVATRQWNETSHG